MSVGAHSLLLPLLLLFLLSLSNGGEPPYYYDNGNFGYVYPTTLYQNPPQGVSSAPQPQYTPKGSRMGQNNWNPAMQYQDAPQNGNRYNQQSSPHRGGMGIRPQQPDVSGMESRSRCPSRVYVGYKQIIDIQKSVLYGAQLLEGRYVSTFKGCVDQCCNYNGCDLALYKTRGVSQTGKSCYFVHCGLPSHCKMVWNEEFQSGFLIQAHNVDVPLDSKEDEKDSSQTKHIDSPTTTTFTSHTTTDPPNTTPSHTKDGTESVAPDHDTTKQPPVPTDSSVTTATKTASDVNTSGTEASPFNASQSSESTSSVPTATNATGNSDRESSGEPPSISRSNTMHTPPSKGVNITTATNLTHTSTTQEWGGGRGEDKKVKRGRNCSRDGCNGSGLIAFTVVGTLIMALLLVAAAVVGRRIHKMRRRKKYRNVDYLINGMYT